MLLQESRHRDKYAAKIGLAQWRPQHMGWLQATYNFMRNFIFTVSLICLIDSGCSNKPKEEYFEKTLISAFQHRDFNEFKNVIIAPKDMLGGLYSNSMNGVPSDRKLVDEYERTYLNDYKSLFDQIINQGNLIGIDWGRVKFENFLYRINDPIVGSGVQLMNCHINFTANGKSYCLYGIDAQKYKSGYKISYIRSIKKGRLEKYIDSNNEAEPTLQKDACSQQ